MASSCLLCLSLVFLRQNQQRSFPVEKHNRIFRKPKEHHCCAIDFEKEMFVNWLKHWYNEAYQDRQWKLDSFQEKDFYYANLSLRLQVFKSSYRIDTVIVKVLKVSFIKNSVHIFNLLSKKNYTNKNMNHFPLMNPRTSASVVRIDKILSKKKHTSKLCSDWKFLCSKTDIDDPFYLQILQHFPHSRHRSERNRIKNNTQSRKQNTSMKSKLCCKNSMLREFICRLRSEQKKNSRYLHLKNLWAFSRVFGAARFVVLHRGMKIYLYATFRNNGRSLHDSWWKFNSKCLKREKKGYIVWNEMHVTANGTLTTLIHVIWRLILVRTWMFTSDCISP